MKASRPIRELYVRLGAEERAKLWRAALKRSDHEDAALLLATCPRQTGSFRELKFAVLAASTAPASLEEILDFVPHTPQPFIVEFRTLEKSREEQQLLDTFRANKNKGGDGSTSAP